MIIQVTTELLEEWFQDLLDLRGEWEWRKDEPRCGYQKSYNELCERIKYLDSILHPPETLEGAGGP